MVGMPPKEQRKLSRRRFGLLASAGSLAAVTLLTGRAHGDHPGKAPKGINRVKSWGYQLQGTEPDAIARTPYDLVVIDYASDDGPFSKAQVEQMKRKPDGSRRLVISYMSIGEAENYRPYWKKAWERKPPVWLGEENPDWRGNYAVQFWAPEWQRMMLDYADKIVAAEFDGVYLDKIDQFEQNGHQEDMVELVRKIAARLRAKEPDFLVIPQNGDALLPNKSLRDTIDAFAREDLFLGEEADGHPNAPTSIKESIARLNLIAAEGKPVLVVEYPSTPEQAEQVRQQISALGFVGLTTSRDLDAS